MPMVRACVPSRTEGTGHGPDMLGIVSPEAHMGDEPRHTEAKSEAEGGGSPPMPRMRDDVD